MKVSVIKLFEGIINVVKDKCGINVIIINFYATVGKGTHAGDTFIYNPSADEDKQFRRVTRYASYSVSNKEQEKLLELLNDYNIINEVL